VHLPRPRFSLATQILGLQLVVLAITVLLGTVASFWLIRSEIDRQYQQRALAVAESVAALPEVRTAVATGSHTSTIQPLAEVIRTSSGASFVVVTDARGIRLSHPNPALIGLSAIDPGEPPVALNGEPYTATETGTLGVSARGKAPIWNDQRRVVGMVSVGYPEVEINAGLVRLLPLMGGYLLVALVLGSAASWLLARHLKRQTFGLEPQEIAGLLEQREAMLHGIREGTVAVDRSNTITLVNDEARRLLGLDGAIVGQRLDDVVPAGRIRDVLTGLEEGPDQIVLSEGRILVANRMPVIVHDEVTGSVTTFRDRTELSGLHRELQGLRGITDALRAQVHEFSNRLHTIAGLIELGRGDEAIRLATEAAVVHQELAERLVERVGDPLLSALLLAKAAVASEQAIELRLSDDTLISSEQPDARDLVTILGNLIDNAFDAVRVNAPDAARWVDVQLREEAVRVVIRVADSGSGIDPVISQRVFDEGFSTKEGTGRTRGLGLALVRQIVKRRGGTIELQNGPGAVFTVRLPRHGESPAGAVAPRRASSEMKASAGDMAVIAPTTGKASRGGSQLGRRQRNAGTRLTTLVDASADAPAGTEEAKPTGVGPSA
jgi:two-component system CitB family sensor kinase